MVALIPSRAALSNGAAMAGEPDGGGFEIWRAAINLGGLVIVGGLIVVIIASLIIGD